MKYVKDYLILLVLLTCLLALGAVTFAQETAPIVRKITITGNEYVSTDYIEQLIIYTKIGQPVDTEKLTQDLDNIAQSGPIYYVAVDSRPYQDGIELIFEITENPVVESVEILGLLHLDPATVRRYISQQDGAVLNARRLDNDIWLAVQKVQDEHGYLIQPHSLQFTEEGVLQIVYRELVYGEIIIEGNEKTKENVIRRELLMQPGEPIRLEPLRQTLGKLMMLGHFQEIEPSLEETNEPHVVNLRLKVTERQTGLANFGTGYSKLDGLVGLIQVQDTNFRGTGNTIDIKWEFGKKKTSYDIGLEFPYLGDSPTSLGLSAYNRTVTRTYDDVPATDHRMGGDVTLGRRLGLFSHIFTRLKIEDINVVSEDETINDDKKLRSLSLIAQTDSRNHPFYPSEGWAGFVSVEVAGRFLGGDLDFTTYRGSASKYFQLGETNKHTIALRVDAGVQTGEVPSYELFRVGGTGSLRGYNYAQFRGEKMLTTSAEYRLKLTDTVQGLVFVDLGNAWDQNTPISLKDLKVGYGIGVRIDTPLGVMGLGYGIGEEGGKTYFTIGEQF
ncbi:MAG TPA: BamA/TamA family outer membrane protein [Firmicutes bacterium]|nr:BamA/TamA family outer membrane protein [Bacillota bacterium]